MRVIAALLALVFLGAIHTPPNISGTWQGTLAAPGIGKLPRVMRISKHAGGYAVKIYSTAESEVPISTNDVRIDGRHITMLFNLNTDPWLNYHRRYEATISPNGSTMSGRWTQAAGGDLINASMVYHRTGPVSLHMLQPARDLYVEVASGVKDEVLDWGGTGRPVVLLAGQGVTGRGWRSVIPDLTTKYHVYSMTRRGYGNSSKPAPTAANYNAERLGKDVLAVLDALHIEKPILVGHSLAGEELSYIGTYAPEKAAALIYLDSAYDYAYDAGIPTPPPSTPPPGSPKENPIDVTIDNNSAHFTTEINLPILAIFAHPTDMKPQPGISQADIDAWNDFTAKQIVAFAKGQPNAKVIVVPNADHFVYISNRDEVLRDINSFIAGLRK